MSDEEVTVEVLCSPPGPADVEGSVIMTCSGCSAELSVSPSTFTIEGKWKPVCLRCCISRWDVNDEMVGLAPDALAEMRARGITDEQIAETIGFVRDSIRAAKARWTN